MTRPAPDAPLVWGHCRINGNLTASGNAGAYRLYVCERFGRVEGWVDSVKLGNFASMGEAKAACLNRVAAPVSQ